MLRPRLWTAGRILRDERKEKMGLFFNADKYITRVESPRVSHSLGRKAQVIEYLNKYFEMYNHEYMDDMCAACYEYIEDTLDEQDEPAKTVNSAEVQAVTTIIKGLQDFIKKGSLNDLKYLKVLASKDAFKMYCGMISKVLELGIIDRKQAKRRIARFYKDCELD
jgi:ribosomal protein S20